jgi:predicted lipoprotein with Yx(FWY)xxD motif
MRIRWKRAVMMAVVGALALAALAVAKSATIGVGRAEVKGHKESVAVNAKGVTIYELGPETTRHLVCKSQACFAAWPPVKAKGAVTKMAGVSGKVGTIKRDGFTQVTLGGKPVYTFVEDSGRRGEAEGDGIRNFGGVWHVIKEG